MDNGIKIRVKGKVQGVGFRPYVWQLAHRLQLCGTVSNDSAGVLIHLLPSPSVAQFLTDLVRECPPLAQIDSIDAQPYHWDVLPPDFSITHSGAGEMDTQVVPDAATCDACVQELTTPGNRRYHYPFINCTHCGPRFTIIRRMPYDRPYTAMVAFPLCAPCASEYQDPADRRFHAQPTACPDCGPHLWICDSSGVAGAQGDEALAEAVTALQAGLTIAIKGVGGFHLACDATQEAAVQRLRQRKRRPGKPLAVMLPDETWLTRCALPTDAAPALRLMKSAAAPIVLLPIQPEGVLCASIAPGLTEVGLMLPSNPLQHLLLTQFGKPLVMTSGNGNGKPPAITNQQALTQLTAMADLWLMHNRDIIQRADDSLVRVQGDSAEMLRRARGYVPDTFRLPSGFEQQPAVLAMGADLKNTFCLLRDGYAIVGQHLGDLTDSDIEQQYQATLTRLEELYRFTPRAIAVDAHPGYISHRLGQQRAEAEAIPCHPVLHHHAHIVACLAEHGWPRDGGAVIGLALDGIGYGEDGQWWGGECLRVDYTSCRYLGGLPAVALPGGDLAARQPWRNLLAQWLRFVPNWQLLPEADVLPQDGLPLLKTAIARGFQSPLASSTGRLFDAVAAAAGFGARTQTWEGEAACWLEALAWQSPALSHPVTMPVVGNQLDMVTFWREWLVYRASPPARAHAFHRALAQGLATLLRQAAEQENIRTLVLSGGVMHNRLLSTLLRQELCDFTVLQPVRLPAGDGGLSLGQALIAAARATSSIEQDKIPY